MIQNIAAIASLASSLFGTSEKQSAPATAPMQTTTGIFPQQRQELPFPAAFPTLPMTALFGGSQESVQAPPMTFLDRALQTLSSIATTIQSMVFSVLGMNSSATIGSPAAPVNVTPGQSEQKGGGIGELLSQGWAMLKETIMQKGGLLETLIGKGIDKISSGVGKLTDKVSSWAKKIF